MVEHVSYPSMRQLLSTLLVAALMSVVCAGAVTAQESDGQDQNQDQNQDGEAQQKDLGTMMIRGEPIFPNRTDDVNPVLNFGQEYFQRFEPTSAGEMLKRLPGVSIVNDVGEYQDPKLRGLPAGYTQVLLNGERMVGSPNNRNPLVSRIPFELVERVEIVRSPSAEIDSSGVGGTLNVITKSPADFDGISLTTGGAYASALEGLSDDTDSEFFKQASLLYGDQVGAMNFLFNASFNERYNPKLQDSAIFEPGTSDSVGPSGFDLVEFESQADTRETDDTALNFRSTIEPEGTPTTISLDWFVVQTDRVETEATTLWEVGFGGFTAPFGSDFDDDEVNVDADSLETSTQPIEKETQVENIEQTQYGLKIGIERPLSDRLQFEGQLNLRSVQEDRDESTSVREFDAAGNVVATGREGEIRNIDNPSTGGKLDFDYKLNEDQTLSYGFHLRLQERETDFRVSEGGTVLTDQSFQIDEDVFSGYIEHEWDVTDRLSLKNGIRLEYTDLRTAGAGEGADDENYFDPNPTLSARYELTDQDRFTASLARTVRRPDFNELEPFVIPEEPGDDSAITGDPTLETEEAWGIDLGYQRSFAGGEGIAGVNFFYRDISDVIELSGTGDTATVGGTTFDLFEFRNAGDGEIYGVETDFSAPLGFVGLPETAVFTNGTFLDHSLEDELLGEDRPFTRTPNWMFNFGVQQGLPSDFKVGYSLHAEDDVRDEEFTEITKQKYGIFMQAFLEKVWPEHDASLRFIVKNITDRTKEEIKREFDSISQRRSGFTPERAIENEQRGRVYKLVLRMNF